MPVRKPKFYVKQYHGTLPEYAKYPCFILVPNDWNDFGFYTTFKLYYAESGRTSRQLIGEVKILYTEQNPTILPDMFLRLNDIKYCSLGQNTMYYKNLNNLAGSIDVKHVMDALNDVAFNTGIREEFSAHPAFGNSLLRFSEAEKAFREGRMILDNIDIDNAFKFTYECRLPNAAEPHQVNFDFTSQSELNKRLICIIGKNGSGKTQYLASLANSMSGNKQDENSAFKPHRPPFSKVIAISYSLFDKFSTPEKNKVFSYVYCGLQTRKGKIDETQLNAQLRHALTNLSLDNKLGEWKHFVSQIISIQEIENQQTHRQDSVEKIFNKLTDKQGLLSSGQSLLMFVLTQVLAYIQPESLILFDEPETHLHPNAIANLMQVLQEILEEYDSYAIVATHSPIVVQNVPSEHVYVFKREDNIPIIHQLGIESFGENLSNITETIFETGSVEEGYKNRLREMSKNATYDQIIAKFDQQQKPLSLNARIFLHTCYQTSN